MLEQVKQRALRLDFIQNWFRSQRGWPVISKGPAGARILVVNPHWDDEILACYGTLYPARERVTLVCVDERGNNPQMKRPYREIDRIDGDYDTVFLPAPWDDHPQHVQASRIPVPDDVEVWCFQVYAPICTNTVVDITTVLAEKYAMLERMGAHLPEQRDWQHCALGRDAYSARHLHRKDKRYAELFMVLKGNEHKLFREEFFRCCKESNGK